MKRLSTFVFIISFVIVQSAFAETPIGSTSYPSAGSGSGTNNTAKEASSSAGMAQMVSMATAAATLPMCTPKTPIYCAIGAANIAAALMMGGGKKNAGAIDKATLAAAGAGGSATLPGLEPGEGFDSGSGTGVDAQLEQLRQEYADLGYTMSPDGSTLSVPGGGTVSTASIASGKAPGFEMTDSVRDNLAAIEAEALKNSGNRVVPIGLQDGGGGGGGGSGGGETPDGSKFDMANYLKGLKNRDPSSVSGLSKKLGDDNIGIKSDNIFEMVSRQYKRKESQSAFIK